MAEILFLVEDAPEGGYTAKALGYSIFTETDTWEDLKLAIQDALECHFEDDSKPRLVRLIAVKFVHASTFQPSNIPTCNSHSFTATNTARTTRRHRYFPLNSS
jgi:hypothetical protein